MLMKVVVVVIVVFFLLPGLISVDQDFYSVSSIIYHYHHSAWQFIYLISTFPRNLGGQLGRETAICMNLGI